MPTSLAKSILEGPFRVKRPPFRWFLGLESTARPPKASHYITFLHIPTYIHTNNSSPSALPPQQKYTDLKTAFIPFPSRRPRRRICSHPRRVPRARQRGAGGERPPIGALRGAKANGGEKLHLVLGASNDLGHRKSAVNPRRLRSQRGQRGAKCHFHKAGSGTWGVYGRAFTRGCPDRNIENLSHTAFEPFSQTP